MRQLLPVGIARRETLGVIATASLLPAGATAQASQRNRELLKQGNVQIDVIVDGMGPAIVLLPSSQRDSEDFDDLAARIAVQGFCVLRPQPRGMGRSSAPPPDMTLATLASDVAVTVEQLGGGRAVLVGHAFGHYVARVADMNHPGMVRGVVVAGGAAKTFPPGLVESLAVAVNPDKPTADRLQALQRAFFAPGNDPAVWLTGWHPKLSSAYRVAGGIPAKELWWPVSNSPILDLQGDSDPWRPARTRNELKDVLGDKVTVQVIPNASHALIPEQPAAVAQAIVAWARALKP